MPAKIKIIAESTSWMNTTDAKAFCQRHGGRLPRINGRDSLAWKDRDEIVYIEGFGALGDPWPSESLHTVYYWTGTEDTNQPGNLWVVFVDKGRVNVFNRTNHRINSVVCVP